MLEESSITRGAYPAFGGWGRSTMKPTSRATWEAHDKASLAAQSTTRIRMQRIAGDECCLLVVEAWLDPRMRRPWSMRMFCRGASSEVGRYCLLARLLHFLRQHSSQRLLLDLIPEAVGFRKEITLPSGIAFEQDMRGEEQGSVQGGEENPHTPHVTRY